MIIQTSAVAASRDCPKRKASVLRVLGLRFGGSQLECNKTMGERERGRPSETKRKRHVGGEGGREGERERARDRVVTDMLSFCLCIQVDKLKVGPKLKLLSILSARMKP